MLRFLTLTACVSLVSTNVSAQTGLPPSVTGHEQFVDETGITVRALAKSAKISEGAARERLKRQVAAAALISETGASGVEVNFDTSSKPTVTVYAAASSMTKLQKATPSLSAMSDGAFKIVQTRFSPAQLDAMADEIIAAAEKQGVKGYVRTDQRTGAMTFVPNKITGQNNATSIAAAISLPYGAVVGSGPQIVKTASSWAGGQYLNFGGGLCTSGFAGYIVLNGVASRGAITAYHCGGPGIRASMDANSSGTYQAPSSVSAFVREYGYSYQQDMLFMRFEDGGNTTAPYFKTGQGSAVVRGATDVAWRSTVCKYGRTTGGSCGSVGYSTVRDGGGTFYIVYTDTAGGDSGGPMWQGNLIAGIVYGSYGSGAMLMNPWKYMRDKYPNIFYTCDC